MLGQFNVIYQQLAIFFICDVCATISTRADFFSKHRVQHIHRKTHGSTEGRRASRLTKHHIMIVDINYEDTFLVRLWKLLLLLGQVIWVGESILSYSRKKRVFFLSVAISRGWVFVSLMFRIRLYMVFTLEEDVFLMECSRETWTFCV
jgi:hypothetical protein